MSNSERIYQPLSDHEKSRSLQWLKRQLENGAVKQESEARSENPKPMSRRKGPTAS